VNEERTGIDLRWVYLLVAAIIAAALLAPVQQPMTPEDAVVRTFEFIESLPPGSTVLLALDFDPQAKAELEPITKALMRHCLGRDLRVIGMTFWWTGAALMQQIFTAVAAEFPQKQVGRDFVYLGYQPGTMAQVITGMGENIVGIFRQDYQNRPTSTMPLFQEVRSLKDVDYIIDLAAGATPAGWILFGADTYGVPMAVGCTAVTGPDMFVRLDAGQINGLIAGLRGAADYEALLGRPDLGMGGMFAQSIIHAIIIAFVVAGNVLFFVRRRREGARRG